MSRRLFSASSTDDDQAALLAVRRSARWLTGAPGELDGLVAQLGAARYALLGEASHGTHEFYETRAALTRRLIVEHGVTAVAVEGDWPDAYRVNRYVRGLPGPAATDTSGSGALAGFQRFPAWMWRNTVVLEFVEWLRSHNASLPPQERVGFYGMDLYSLFGSIRAVLQYLDRTDPAAAARARYRYGCFDRFRENTQAYGYAASFDMSQSCEDAVVAQLLELLQADAANAVPSPGADPDPDAQFHAEQNARLVRNAERYYRAMFHGRATSWNLRDEHMAETLDALDEHLRARSGDRQPPRFAVWAHNSHLGDARATEMGEQGELNLGQLLRQRHGDDAFLLGFSTYTGSVTAATAWDEPGRREPVRPGLPDSYEALFHEALRQEGGKPSLLLALRGQPALAEALAAPRLQRAIGVIYAPQTERWSHYFHTRLAQQFDAMLHIDTTRALEPLATPARPPDAEPPATYPSGK